MKINIQSAEEGRLSFDSDAIAHKLAEEFIRWPLPNSVCVDLCATRQCEGRIGTNLLSYSEAKEMFKALALPYIAAEHDARVAAEKKLAMWKDEAEEMRQAFERSGEHKQELAQRIALAEERLAELHDKGPIVDRLTNEIETVTSCLCRAQQDIESLQAQLAAAESENARLHRSVLAMERLKIAFERAFNYSRTYIESERLERYWAEIEKAETAVAALAPAPTAEAKGERGAT